MPKKNQHVVPHEGGWAVKGAGNNKATSVHSTQAAAIKSLTADVNKLKQSMEFQLAPPPCAGVAPSWRAYVP